MLPFKGLRHNRYDHNKLFKLYVYNNLRHKTHKKETYFHSPFEFHSVIPKNENTSVTH